MANTKYSHAFLVGCFNGDLKSENLDKKWKLDKKTKEDYALFLSIYYQSHVDAMIEAESQINKPDFLKDVHHYIYSFQEDNQNVVLTLNKDKKQIEYKFRLINLHLYLFPLGINLVGIEIDDTGVGLDNLTFAHGKLINWEENISDIEEKINPKNIFKPLTNLLGGLKLSSLIKDGNNMKIFQIVQCEDDAPDDKLLFEIATFSPISSVGKNTSNSHSTEYFNKIMKENSVSTFHNWKALSLVDSFTILGGKDFKSWQWENMYYPLIYLRCILEKTYCFSRNNAYRLGQDKDLKELSKEISEMEKYYFYNKFSYNFQPNLVYESMVKGLDVKTEREELSRQIKEKTKQYNEKKKEREERRRNIITLELSVLTVFSIAWDLCSLIKDAFTGCCTNPTARIIFYLSLIVIVFLVIYIFFINKKEE